MAANLSSGSLGKKGGGSEIEVDDCRWSGEKGDGEVVTCEEGDDAPGSGWVVFIGH